MLLEKRFSCREARGGAVGNSGVVWRWNGRPGRTGNLVQRQRNRKSYIKRRDSHGGSTAVGRVDCCPVVAGSGRASEKTGIAAGRFGGGSGPGDGCRRCSCSGSPG